MLTKTKAIVLRYLKYGEQKMIIDLLTETDGRVSVVTHIPKTQRGKLKKQYFQPLNILEVELDIHPRAQLQHLKDAHIVFPFTTIPFDPYKLSIALFLAEFIHYSTRDEQQNPTLFAYIEHSLQWLDGCTSSFANFHLVFMMRLSRFIGFFPYVEDYHEGDMFDLRAASFTQKVPMHNDYLTAVDAARINNLLRMNYASMHLFKMNHDDRNRIVDVIVNYYRLHVPAFPELRSLDVMKELWR
jgi:DNA repair protein RecO (recombination protein O)